MTHDPLAGCRVLGFDLETTGLQKKSHRIIQFALVGSDHDGSSIHFESLVNPQRKIPADSIRVHGIHDTDVKHSQLFGEHIEQLNSLFDDAVVVGHNVKAFDWPFMENEYLRCGKIMPQPKAIIDTLQVARKLRIPKPHGLGPLCQRFNIKLENAHDAGADAAASLLLLWKMMEADPKPFRRPLEDLQTWLAGTNRNSSTTLGPGYDDLEPFDADGKIRIDGDNLIIVFGRHRGSTLTQIATDDEGYINWLLSPNGPFQEVDRNKIRARL
jgi:DNA polymerase III epsilon subunit family exonuclease